MTDFSDFDSRFSRYLDGALNADELAEMEAKLIEDDAFADYFSRWCLAHRHIVELVTETKLHDLMDQFVHRTPGLPKRGFRPSMNSAARAIQANSKYWQVGKWLTLGAAAAVLAVLLTWQVTDWSLRNSASKSTARNTITAERAELIATLTQVVDGAWSAGAPVLRHGQQLAKGSRIALDSGMAKVTYDCGAEVVLQGPCEFVVEDSMLGRMLSGRMTAHVPRRAFSFAILSPQVDFVDLGTSFGVDVGKSGSTQLHVFEGEVLCSQPKRPAAARSDVIHVLANKAMEFTTSNSPPSDIALNQQQFARLIALRRAADFEAGHLVEDELALWLAADVAVTTDPQQRVISWQDIVYGENESAEDAIQTEPSSRPLLVTDSINGRPALRFDGNSDFLLTTPLETADDQTVLMVMQYSPTAYGKDRRWGGQILNYDGPNHMPEDHKSDKDLAERTRYLSNTIVPGVLQIGEPLREDEFRPTLLTGQVFAGFIGSATVESGRVDTVEIGADRPVVLAFLYDYEYEHGKSFLAINGRRFGEARAFAPQGVTSRKIIGRHAWKQLFFHGDLAELLIFNKALSANELELTTSYLADKYGIALESAMSGDVESN